MGPGAIAATAEAGVNVAALDGLLEPIEVAEEALACLAAGTFLCMPGGETRGPQKHVARKGADRQRWIDGMRRLQRRMAGDEPAAARSKL